MNIPARAKVRSTFKNETFQRYLLIFIILVPIALEGIYIKFFGVNVPFADQWNITYYYLERLYINNNISFLDILASQNAEHRIFFPLIIWYLSAYLTHYNVIYELYFSWFVAILITLLLFLMFKKSFGNSLESLMAFIPISFIIFNFRQFESILWGPCLSGYLSIFGLILAIYMLERSKAANLNFLLAIFGGILASYSDFGGLAIWPTGLVFILILRKEKILVRLWSLIGILTISLYFHNLHLVPTTAIDYFFAIKHPIEAMLYLLAITGLPLATEKIAAISRGVFLISILFIELIFLIKYARLRENGKWLSLILFSFITSFMIMVGRIGWRIWGNGIDNAPDSRYVTFTMIGIIGVYILLLDIYNIKSKNKISAILLGMFVSILGLGLLLGYTYGLEQGQLFKESRIDGAYLLETYKLQIDDHFKDVWIYPHFREVAPFLEKYKLNVFSDEGVNLSVIPKSQGTTLYNIDIINSHYSANNSTGINLNEIPKSQGRIQYSVDIDNSYHSANNLKGTNLSETPKPQGSTPFNIISIYGYYVANNSYSGSMIINKTEVDEIKFSGWAIDLPAGKLAKAVFIMIDNKLIIPMRYFIDRIDVADSLKNGNFRYSGFRGSFATSLLAKGSHNLTVSIVSNKGDQYYNMKPDINITIVD